MKLRLLCAIKVQAKSSLRFCTGLTARAELRLDGAFRSARCFNAGRCQRKTGLYVHLLCAILFITLLTSGGHFTSHAQGNSTPTPLNLNATPNATGKATSVIRVFGHVTNGTAGAKLPETLKLTLTVTGIDENDLMSTGPKQILVRDTDMAADGNYAFSNVPGQLGYTYVITARYAGGLQTSPAVILKNARVDLEVPFTVYEASADPLIVSVTRLTVNLDFSSTPGFVQLYWSYEFAVAGDRLFLTASKTTQGDPISIVIPLPPDAQNISPGNDTVSKHLVIDAASLQDTLPVLPGEKHTITFNYRLPYRDNLTVTQQMRYGASNVQVKIPAGDDKIKLTGDGFNVSVSQTATSPADSFNLYEHAGIIAPNGSLAFTISGAPSAVPTPPEPAPTPTPIPYFLLGGGILLIAVAGIVLLARRNQRTAPTNSAKNRR